MKKPNMIDYRDFKEDNKEELLRSALRAIDPDLMGMTRENALTLAGAMKNCGLSKEDFAEVLARSSQDKGTFAKQWDKFSGRGKHGEAGEGTIFDFALQCGWKWPAPTSNNYQQDKEDKPKRPRLLAPEKEGVKVVCIFDGIPYKSKPNKTECKNIRKREKIQGETPAPIITKDFAKAVITGHTFTPGIYSKDLSGYDEKGKPKYNYRTIEQQIFIVDIDNEEQYKDDLGKVHKRRIEEPLDIATALEICKENDIAPFFVYETFSSKLHREDPEEPYTKFRLCFAMDKPLTVQELGEKGLLQVREWFINLFGKAADTTTTDTSRLFFGTDEADRARLFNAVIDSKKFMAQIDKPKKDDTPANVEVIPTNIVNATKEQLFDGAFIESALNCNGTERQEQIKEILFDRARELKCITSFKFFVAKIIKAQTNKGIAEKITGYTEFKHKILNKPLAIGENYISESGKIYGIKKAKNDSGIDELFIICPCPVYPLERLCNIENNKERLTIAFYKDGKWIEKTVEKLLIANHSKVVELSNFGLPITSVNAKSFVSLMAAMEYLNKDIPRVNTANCFGWCQDPEGQLEFVPYSQKIKFDGMEEFKDLAKSIKPHGSKEKWFDLVKRIRANTNKQYMPQLFMAVSLASVLLKPLGLQPFWVNSWGLTGRGKTANLKLCTSIWGDPGESKYIMDGDTTATALFVRASVLKHLPLCIDDFSKLDLQKLSLESLIYTLCSGTDRARATKEGGAREVRTWRNAIITTFEHPLIDDSMKGGAINRVLDFEIPNEDIFEDPGEIFNTVQSNYGFFGSLFIEKVQEIGTARLLEIQKDFEKKIIAAAAELGEKKEAKQILPLSVILTADKIATEIFQDGKHLNVKDLTRHLKGTGEVSDGQRAYEHVLDYITINRRNFINLDRADLGENHDFNSGFEVLGYLGTESPNKFVFLNGLQLDIALKNTNYNKKVLLNWLKEKQLIKLSNSGFSSIKKIYGTPQRVYAIKILETKEEEPGAFLQDTKAG